MDVPIPQINRRCTSFSELEDSVEAVKFFRSKVIVVLPVLQRFEELKERFCVVFEQGVDVPFPKCRESL